MTWTQILGSVIGTIAMTVAMTALVWSAHRAPQMDDQRIVLRYVGLPRWTLIGCAYLFGAGTTVLLAAALFGALEPKDVRAICIAAPLLMSMGIWAAMELRVDLELDRDGVRGRTAWRGRQGLRWDEIVKVRWSGVMQCFTLVDREGECVRVCRYLRGAHALLPLLEERVREEIAGHALLRYRRSVEAGL